ncbi:hypothetical protein [Sporosarcina sp. Te-1]|uniref:hypothetical protein n=1 Tax=Sporosarcina sp. Te-1 TaxID=2818390 RepID=UPI001A9D387E|nr:hypothetical protein [Sporosarcina sp. Te-1]QTD41683.1 hypothetical protein J3U78_02175 [Sporosarcina sp. Te-1]
MRTLFAAIILFFIFHILKEDLTDGTIPLAAFFTEEEPCVEDKPEMIQVTTIDGDTIESLFALYPDASQSFIERLSIFYSLNPHLQNQQIIGGLTVKLPLSTNTGKQCD